MAFLAAIPLVPKHLSRGLIGFVFWALFSLLCALGLLFFVFFFAFTFFPFQMQNPEPFFLSVSLCTRQRGTQITSLTISIPMILKLFCYNVLPCSLGIFLVSLALRQLSDISLHQFQVLIQVTFDSIFLCWSSYELML